MLKLSAGACLGFLMAMLINEANQNPRIERTEYTTVYTADGNILYIYPGRVEWESSDYVFHGSAMEIHDYVEQTTAAITNLVYGQELIVHGIENPNQDTIYLVKWKGTTREGKFISNNFDTVSVLGRARGIDEGDFFIIK